MKSRQSNKQIDRQTTWSGDDKSCTRLDRQVDVTSRLITDKQTVNHMIIYLARMTDRQDRLPTWSGDDRSCTRPDRHVDVTSGILAAHRPVRVARFRYFRKSLKISEQTLKINYFCLKLWFIKKKIWVFWKSGLHYGNVNISLISYFGVQLWIFMVIYIFWLSGNSTYRLNGGRHTALFSARDVGLELPEQCR